MRFFTICILSFFLLTGCSASFDEQSEETIKVVEEIISSKPKEPNKEVEDIKFFLPFGFEIGESSPNNIILKNGLKTYILFYNQNEDHQSDIVYNSTLNQHKKLELDKKWNEKGRFSYLLIESLDDDLNELIVGMGGVKLTSEVKTSNLPTEASQMMEIVNSVSLLMAD